MYSANYEESAGERPIGTPCVRSLNYIQASGEPDWSFHMHSHEDTLEISYVLSGKGSLYCGGRFFALHGGDIVIKNPLVRHAENSDRTDPLEQVCIIVDGLEAEEGRSNTIPLGSLSPVIPAEEDRILLDAVFRKILRETIGLSDPNMEYVNSLMSFALRAILHRTQDLREDMAKNEHGDAMQQVRTYIEDHFARSLSLETIADRFHLSHYYLSRQFKKYTGFTLNNYIISCRIGEAQRRLIFKEESIGEICTKCGYESLSYFYTSFRKKVGCTPAEYRRIYRVE